MATMTMLSDNPQWSLFVNTAQSTMDDFLGYLPKNEINKDKPMNDLESVLAVEAAYFAIVFFGMQMMKLKEKPFNLYYFKLVHNFILFALSAYMCLETIRQAYLGGYKLFGNPMEKGHEPHANGMASVVYVFYLSKVYEFVDTIIMILTKKFNQVSVLHVYHHSSILLVWHAIGVYAPGGDAYFSVILNSFVHVVMYAYYFFSAQGYTFVKPVKPYITSMQMFQFMCMLVQSVYDFLNPVDYPRGLVILLGWYMLSLLALFGNFFIQSYLVKKSHKKSKTN